MVTGVADIDEEVRVGVPLLVGETGLNVKV